MTRSAFVSLAIVCGAYTATSSPCRAQLLVGPTPYVSLSSSPFDISHPTFVVETFEDDLFNVQGVTSNMTSSAVIGPGGLTDSVDADDGSIDGSGTNGHSMFNTPGSIGIRFTFSSSVLGGLPTHAGIVWTDGEGTTTFEAFGPGLVSIGVIGPVQIADGSVTGQTAEDRFFGIVHAGGIQEIRITNSSGGIEVDHLQFSFAPSGASVWNYGAGCGASATQIPTIAGIGLPQLGNSGFGFAIGNAQGSTLALLGASLSQSDQPIGACRLLLGGAIEILGTSALIGGNGSVVFPVPNLSSLVGVIVYGQFVALDPNGPFLGLGSLSGGLAARVGT